jgi:ligand-binding sensor domain-containing protein
VLKILFLVAALQTISYSLFSQQENPYPFAHYNVNNGLAAYNSNTIVQDKQGFMWIGTISGLQRFDGHRFLTFRRIPGNRNSMSDNYIDHLFYDSKGNLWLILGNGELGTFNTKTFKYSGVKLTVKDERTTKMPRQLLEDSDGKLLYVIAGQEITTYDPRLREFSAAHNSVRLPKNWNAMSIVEDASTKRYWIATDSGMCVYNTRTRFLSYRGHNAERLPFINRFGGNTQYHNLKIDSLSRFWFTSVTEGMPAAINCYDLRNDSLTLHQDNLQEYIKKDYTIKRILIQDDGNIWIAGINIFMKYNEPSQKFLPVSRDNNDRNIQFQEVNYLLEDKENNIWLSTDNNGLFVFRPTTQLFKSVKHVNRRSGKPDEGGVITLSFNHRNEILAAVNDDGIHRYDQTLNALPEDKHSSEEKKPYTIWSMCRLKDDNTIWMGLQSGILIYNSADGRARYINPKLFEDKLVRSIAQDKLGNIWIGTPGAGVFKWNPELAKGNIEAGFTFLPHLPNTLIEKINVDSKGFVWVCTLMNGVYKLDPASNSILEHLTTQGPVHKRLLADAATEAFELNDSLMVIATGALNFYNTRSDTITPITSADGMPSDIIRCIEKDSKGNLWLGMFNGLSRMNVQKKTFTYYDRNDGMVNDNFYYSSSCHLPDGRLVFGTTTDFIVFDPEDLNTVSTPPDVTITDFMLMNRNHSLDSLSRLRRIEIGPDQNLLSIGFSGLSYFHNKFSYYYMMEGLEKEWKKAESQNQVNYNFLPAGKYKFKVRAENADGVSSSKITELNIKVNPPLLQSWWFYSIILLLVAVLLYIIDNERMRRKAAIQKMRSQIADNLHSEVNTALNRINIMSEMARIKAEKDPERSIEYFEQIHKKSHDMIIAMDDMLWSIDPANDSMHKMVERIKEYIDSLKNRTKVTIDLLVDKKVESLVLNMKLRHDIFLMMKEGIRSVVDAGSKNIKIHIALSKDELVYTIQIDNKDVDHQQLHNLLQQIQLEQRLKAMRATLKSNMHRYTSTFELNVPVA